MEQVYGLRRSGGAKRTEICDSLVQDEHIRSTGTCTFLRFEKEV